MITFSTEGDLFKLAKKALVFVEGTHKDSMGRTHNFDFDRVKEFVDNTNEFLRQGGRLPFQMDHRKTQEYNIGDVEGELYIKTITEDDLPNPNYKHLIGRAGVFVDSIIGKGKDIVEKINSGLIKTLSPGLDPMTKSFIEISATPTPAIIGPALFSKSGDYIDNYIEFELMPETSGSGYKGAPNIKEGGESTSLKEKTFSFDALKSKKNKLKKKEEEYEELSEDLFEILISIYCATDEELAAESMDPVSASYDAIEYFLSNLEVMFDLVESEKTQKDLRNKYMANGAKDFPTGLQPSDYSKEKSNNDLQFNKKVIGYIIN
jgi:hypothetical protein